MEWKVELKRDVGIISTVVSGTVTLAGIKKISAEVFKLAKQNNVNKLICDFRKVSLDISTYDIHILPQTFIELGRTPRQKSAIVHSVNSPDRSNYSFYDDRCSNTALNTKVFTDFDEAYKWLIHDTK